MTFRTDIIASEKGLTLVEILSALVILGIIVVTFMTYFIQSARSNSISEDIIEATYLAQTEVEKIQSDYEYLATLNREHCTGCYSIEEPNHYIWIVEKVKDSHIHIIVKVYASEKMQQLKAQMETILPYTLEELEGEN